MPSGSDLEALTLTLASDGDGDDDFQDPGAAARIIILSSLKPSRGSGSRKRPKLVAAPGKENRGGKPCTRPRSRTSKAFEEKRSDLAAPVGSNPVNTLSNSVSNSHATSKATGMGGKVDEKKDKVMDLGTGVNEIKGCSGCSNGHFSLQNGFKKEQLCHSVGNGYALGADLQIYKDREDCEKVKVEKGNHYSMSIEEKSCILVQTGSNSMKNGCASEADLLSSKDCGDNKKLKVGKGNYYSMSIESRLLGSIRRSDSSSVEVGSVLEKSGCDEFEPGTQLNELMNLCAEFNEKGSDFASKAVMLGDNTLIECPLCGRDITELSEELRHAHTNYCLGESGNSCSVVSESRPLDTRRESVPEIESDFRQRDCCRDLEQDVDLEMQMNLVSEVDVEGVSYSEVALSVENELDINLARFGYSGFVECPLCGTDITSLSEELRQVHTNSCLDKNGATEVYIPSGRSGSDSHQQVVDINPVFEWLRALDLSKYEEAFATEEIDWETLQWLTEEDLISMGIVALGPRKKIVHALNELRKRNDHPQNIAVDASNITVNDDKLQAVPGNKLITEYFQGTVGRNRICSNNRQVHGMEKNRKESVCRKVTTRNHISKRKSRDIPPWCSIPGTPFQVDAFCYLRGDCSHWFLTHFHIDHYQGLTRNFCHGKIYCSSITAHLVNMKIGVPWDRLHILPLNQKICIAGVNLTCLDANHCPGSIIILFEPLNGKTVLHTGDFRYSEEMASNFILRSCHVHTLILDTTYCNPQYEFPKQEAVVQFVIEAIQAEAFNTKTLFLIGSYTIGKEKLFLQVARMLRKKVHVGPAKLRLLSCMGFPEEDMQWLTVNEMDSQIHVVPMWTIASFKRMKHISNQYSDRFNLIVAFSPTGWTLGKGKKKTPGRRWQQGTIIRYEVPYSEHCSFTELQKFVQLVSPEHIIPSVNNEGPESVDAMIALLMSES